MATAEERTQHFEQLFKQHFFHSGNLATDEERRRHFQQIFKQHFARTRVARTVCGNECAKDCLSLVWYAWVGFFGFPLPPPIELTQTSPLPLIPLPLPIGLTQNSPLPRNPPPIELTQSSPLPRIPLPPPIELTQTSPLLGSGRAMWPA